VRMKILAASSSFQLKCGTSVSLVGWRNSEQRPTAVARQVQDSSALYKNPVLPPATCCDGTRPACTYSYYRCSCQGRAGTFSPLPVHPLPIPLSPRFSWSRREVVVGKGIGQQPSMYMVAAIAVPLSQH
jgi:hypothetical protein